MTTILGTGLDAESSYNGFMFSIKALQDVEVQALYAESQSALSIDVTIYSASGAWEACKSRFAAWEHVGNGSFTKVRGASNRVVSHLTISLRRDEVKKPDETRAGAACVYQIELGAQFLHSYRLYSWGRFQQRQWPCDSM